MSEIRVAYSELDVQDLDASTYPDGLPLVPWPWPGVLSFEANTVKRLLVRPSSVRTLMTALWFVDAIVERGVKPPELILPCIPGARQDRLNPEGDYLFTLKSVAREINLRQFPKVTVLDPHSDVGPALIERCEVITVATMLRADIPLGSLALSDYGGVVSPDAGAEKRAGKVATLIRKPLLHAWKTRNVKTGEITGFGIENLFEAGIRQGSRVLVVDDICDGGGTFIGLAELLTRSGIAADLWTTHGYYTHGTDRLRDAGYRRLFTTDSVLHESSSPTYRTAAVLPICDHLLRKGHL